ncbi:AfsR/SARP family transcriptional regulator [Nocardia jejuensis]|uniref:AfsR/SARP family transcriptional regulator n=1 Tax=Nocardia jejuensis TaxID=328049 RepID=UPI0014709029|nr:BTAD domain-containing putative transcriptional regulator [Nocardia jejuensis]
MRERRILVLGPLQVILDGSATTIGGRVQRALLGRLVLARGQAVSAGRLIEDIWQGAPPRSAGSILQVQVHNLRHVLEPDRPRRAPATVLVSESSGYALRLKTEEVDAWRFEELLREFEVAARDHRNAPDPDTRLRMMDAALASWRGSAYESFDDARWVSAEIARLTDLRLRAIELRARAALELDRPAEVVIDLRRAAAEYPDREETCQLLAIAQYRLGQQAEALATLRNTRAVLLRELGVDPGPRLQELETAILTQDPALDRTHGSVFSTSRPRH